MKYKIHSNHLALNTLVGLITLTLSLPPSALALQQPTGLSNTQSSVNCDDFCTQFVPTSQNNSNQVAAGLLSSNPWSNTDDSLCAEIGQATSTSYSASPIPAASAAPTCNNVTLTPNILAAITKGGSSGSGISATSDPSSICIEASKIQNHCLYHNSQVESQCIAYKAITGSQGGGLSADSILLGLDFGVATICTVACVSMNSAAITLCSLAATAEGVSEAIYTVKQLTGPVSHAIAANQTATGLNYGSTIGAGLGAAAGVGLGATHATNQWGSNEESKAKPVEKTGATEAEKEAAKEAEKEAATQEKEKGKALACGTAALFAILGGVRTASMVMLSKTSADACHSINSLFSSNSGGAGSSSGSGNGNGASGSKGGNSSGGSGVGSSGGSANSAATGGNLAGINSDQLNQLSNCLRGNPSATNAQCQSQAGIGQTQTTASTDANLFTPNKNAGPLLAPTGNLGDLVKKAVTEGAGPALGSILPASTGNAGATLATLASTAQAEAPSLAEALHMGSAYASGGGGGKGPTGGAASADPFASLFGAPGGTGGGSFGTPSNIASFGEAPMVQDIWHTGTKLTLFQIISEKTWRVSNRVQQLDPRVFDPRE